MNKRNKQGIQDLNHLPGFNKTAKKLSSPPLTSIGCEHKKVEYDSYFELSTCDECGETFEGRKYPSR